MSDILIKPLAAAPELMPVVQAWFQAEWPAYYGPGGRGVASRDVSAYCNIGSLPTGLLAFHDGEPCGFAALKREPFPTHRHLSPWTGAAYVVPPRRRQGVGDALLKALETEALKLGHTRLYCATATTDSLLIRCGWRLLEEVPHEGTRIGIYERALQPVPRPAPDNRPHAAPHRPAPRA